jgi:hypothetical protein
LTIRFACWNELISTNRLASQESHALVTALLAAQQLRCGPTD